MWIKTDMHLISAAAISQKLESITIFKKTSNLSNKMIKSSKVDPKQCTVGSRKKKI